jgi:hypothetical protein
MNQPGKCTVGAFGVDYKSLFRQKISLLQSQISSRLLWPDKFVGVELYGHGTGSAPDLSLFRNARLGCHLQRHREETTQTQNRLESKTENRQKIHRKSNYCHGRCCFA